MEIKKSPRASLENKKSISILIGLVVALGLTFVAFELSEGKKEESKAFKEEAKVMVEDEDMMESTHQDEPPKPELPPPPQEKILSDVIEVQDNDAEVEEIDFNSMQSKKHKGLYITGELVDIDGICGGYNLHWAWTSGIIVGENIIKNFRGKNDKVK